MKAPLSRTTLTTLQIASQMSLHMHHQGEVKLRIKAHWPKERAGEVQLHYSHIQLCLGGNIAVNLQVFDPNSRVIIQTDGRVQVHGQTSEQLISSQNPRIVIIHEEEKKYAPEQQHPAVGAPIKQSVNNIISSSTPRSGSNLQGEKQVNFNICDNQQQLKPINFLAAQTNQDRKKKIKRFQTDKMIMSHYQIIKVIGKGSFGEVTKAKDLRTNKFRAIKKIKKSAVQQAGTGFCDGGELFDQITQCGNFSENMAADIIRQVLSAVVYCHQHNIVHRDLKPENLLLEFKRTPEEGNNVKVIDFGTSIEYSPEQKLRARLGTAYYIAPEVLRGEYDEKCDVWSCGVILYILLCGYPPFNGDTDSQIFDRIKSGKFIFPSPEWDCVSQEAKKLIKHMLEFDPKKRISAQVAIQDDWLQNFVRNERKLQASIFQYIANQLISTDEEQELRRIFQALDENGDGVVTRDELRKGIDLFQTTFGLEGEFLDIDNLLQKIDIDGSGNIDIKEFITATMNLKDVIHGKQLKQAFNLFDIDGNGQITKKELQRVLGGVLKLSESQWDEFIKDIDIDKDGTINFEEFRAMISQITKI
eukprot:403341129